MILGVAGSSPVTHPIEKALVRELTRAFFLSVELRERTSASIAGDRALAGRAVAEVAGVQWAYSSGRRSMTAAIAGSIRTWPHVIIACSPMAPAQ